jgi:hypothetical protein
MELPEMVTATNIGLNYLQYITETWMPESLWQGWSHHGCKQASRILNISVEGVLPTTNHLEAFNGLLKWKHIHRWQCAGKRLCVDMFVFLLIPQILPNIFHCQSAQTNYNLWLSNRFWCDAGGVDLVAQQHAHAVAPKPLAIPVAWWSPDNEKAHIEEATHMVLHSRVSQVRWIDQYTIFGTCASSMADIRKPNHKQYDMCISVYGWACCQCANFNHNIGAWKHLWALHLSLLKLFASSTLAPSQYMFCYPISESEARSIFQQCFTAPQSVCHFTYVYCDM